MDFHGGVDLQINGFQGVSFSDPGLTEAQVRQVCREYAKHGTAVFCPTVITSSMKTYEAVLPLLARCIESPGEGSSMPGIHLEGPYFSPGSGAMGAHDPRLARKPDPGEFDHLMELSRGNIRLFTCGADVPGIEKLIARAAAAGVTVSLGHHMATHAQIKAAASAGATLLTHLGNGIPATLPRHPNPIWAGLAACSLTPMLITDGFHCSEDFILSVLAARGYERVILTSDMAPAAGLPPGLYQVLGNRAVLEPCGRIFDPVQQHLVGSGLTLSSCAAFFQKITRCTDEQLRRVCRDNPLRAIGL